MSFGERKSHQSGFVNTGSSEPMIGVHVLAQFEFCQRAGVISSEVASEDTGEESESPQRLDYLPDYEESLIRESLTSTMMAFWFASLLLATGVVAVGWMGNWRIEFGILSAVPLGVILYWWFRFVRAIVILRSRLDAAMNAVPREPNLLHLSEQIFNWWDLRRAGYQVDRMPEPMTDSNRGLIGRPWRVLRKGSLRIPVFRKHRGKQVVHNQQRTRIAAYCHLIESCEGSSAPFGLVMFAGSYDVVVVPNNGANQATLSDVVHRARQVLSSRNATHNIPVPARSACESCPLGRPRSFVPLEFDLPESLAPQSIRLSTGVGGLRYHSECGDRFDWIPPHKDATNLRLS